MRALDVAIIGAGPAGLASALYLKRAGHRPVIFERFDKAAPVGSGLMLQPTGLTVLADLGLYDAIMGLGRRIERLHGLDAKSGRVVLDARYDAQDKGRFGLAVNRHALFSVLFDAVAREGIEIRTGSAVTDIEPAGNSSRVIGDNGVALGCFDLVADTSGARSRLRRHAFHPAEPKALPFGALWATLDWPEQGFEPHALTQRYDRASVMIGVLPTGRMEPGSADRMAFFWSIKPQDFAAVKSAGLDVWKQRVRGYWPECAVFLDQIDSFEGTTLATYGHHTLKVPAGRGIAFVGDSAHSASPQLGQGANMALLDARALGHAVACHKDVGEALQAYARSRRRHVALFQAMSALFTPFYQSDSATLAWTRDRIVAPLSRLPMAQKLLASMVSGTLGDPFTPIGLAEKDWR